MAHGPTAAGHRATGDPGHRRPGGRGQGVRTLVVGETAVVEGPVEPLAGGVANRGSVVRVGDTVRRPAGPWSVGTRALLEHLEAVGFEEAPRYLGTDGQGRDVLSYLEGVVPLPPFPAWSMTDAVLEDLAGLLRRFHQALEGFEPGDPAVWSDELADPGGGPVVCHNDVCPENVVYRGGRAIGLVDFDFAAPGRPAWDVVRTVVMWAPMAHPDFRRDFPAGLDAWGRFARFAAAYGFGPQDATALVDLMVETRRSGRRFLRRHLDAGEPAFIEMWERAGGAERDRRNDEWVAEHRGAAVAALAEAL